ncbi:MAG: hypothetical protein P9L99_16320 [Candidatus Lernaella stagnicola]|nr:hypothetical protein [Candidatus Lernaella stagnicola]
MPKKRLRLFSLLDGGDPIHVDFSESELVDQLGGEKTSLLFMGHFEKKRTLKAFERFGILERLRELGYLDIHLEFHARGPREHFMRIYDTTDGEPALLGEVVLREGRYITHEQFVDGFKLPHLDVLAIEWILMQHFKGVFPEGRSRLPGQQHPGLGVGSRVQELLTWVATLLEKDALMNIPEYFHNAVFYDRWFKFIDPAAHGAMLAINEQLAAQGYDLAAISFAVYLDCLVDSHTGENYKWETSEMMLPQTQEGRNYFAQPDYSRQLDEARASMSITIDRPRFERKMCEHDPNCEG